MTQISIDRLIVKFYSTEEVSAVLQNGIFSGFRDQNKRKPSEE